MESVPFENAFSTPGRSSGLTKPRKAVPPAAMIRGASASGACWAKPVLRASPKMVLLRMRTTAVPRYWPKERREMAVEISDGLTEAWMARRG